MADQRVCFIISPIGEKDTDTRRHADNFINRLVKPSLSGLNFSVVRVDQSFKDLRITDEIVFLIKNSELCIVDCVGYNPNVMYELGRRHETGRPVILLRPVAQNIIFDLKDIKHIEYDLNEVDSVIEVQNLVRTFLEEFDRQGFISSESTVNIDKISATLDRVERRIDDITAMLSQRSVLIESKDEISNQTASQLIASLGYDRALIYCIKHEMIREAESVLQMLEPKLPKDLFNYYLARIAGMGSKSAFTRLEIEVIPTITSFDNEEIKSFIAQYVNASNIFDEEARAIDLLLPVIKEDLLERLRDRFDESDRAFLINQIGRLYGGGRDPKMALGYYETAIQLNPSEAAYYYNAASAAKSADYPEKLTIYIDKLKDFYFKDSDIHDDDHLSLMYKVYKNTNRTADSTWALERLKAKNPLLASVLATENS